MELTIDLLEAVFPNATKSNIVGFVTTFNNLKWLHKISDEKEIACYIAQVGVETNELLWREELASGDDYDGREDLGNMEKGDGRKFKGRAYLHVTGRFNYTEFTKWYNEKFKDSEDFVAFPEKLKTDIGLAQIASIWFWLKNKVGIPARAGRIVKVSKIVNGGKNGLERRENYYNEALKFCMARALD